MTEKSVVPTYTSDIYDVRGVVDGGGKRYHFVRGINVSLVRCFVHLKLTKDKITLVN